jgi:hypothetical protein
VGGLPGGRTGPGALVGHGAAVLVGGLGLARGHARARMAWWARGAEAWRGRTRTWGGTGPRFMDKLKTTL